MFVIHSSLFFSTKIAVSNTVILWVRAGSLRTFMIHNVVRIPTAVFLIWLDKILLLLFGTEFLTKKEISEDL